eukprot:sb/3479238/
MIKPKIKITRPKSKYKMCSRVFSNFTVAGHTFRCEKREGMVIYRRRKTLKSGCLPLLTFRRFWHSRRVRDVVRVWLGFGLGVSVSAIDSLSDAV